MVSDLNTLRTRLQAKRQEIQEALRYFSINTSSEGPAEGVEDTGEMAREMEEQEEKQSILANQRALLDEVEQALQRLDLGTYGRCMTCGQSIPIKRLKALPWAARDVECEARREKEES